MLPPNAPKLSGCEYWRDGVFRISFDYSLRKQPASWEKPSQRIPQRLQILILQSRTPQFPAQFDGVSEMLLGTLNVAKHHPEALQAA